MLVPNETDVPVAESVTKMSTSVRALVIVSVFVLLPERPVVLVPVNVLVEVKA